MQLDTKIVLAGIFVFLSLVLFAIGKLTKPANKKSGSDTSSASGSKVKKRINILIGFAKKAAGLAMVLLVLYVAASGMHTVYRDWFSWFTVESLTYAPDKWNFERGAMGERKGTGEKYLFTAEPGEYTFRVKGYFENIRKNGHRTQLVATGAYYPNLQKAATFPSVNYGTVFLRAGDGKRYYFPHQRFKLTRKTRIYVNANIRKSPGAYRVNREKGEAFLRIDRRDL